MWVPISLLLAVVLGLTALASWVTRRVFRSDRLGRFAALAATYLLLDLSLLLVCTALWCRHPRAGRQDRSWVASHVVLLRWALNVLVRCARRTIGFEIDLDDELPRDEDTPILLLSRHAGPGDSFTLVWLILERFRRCPRVVMKDVLQWDPGLDVILNRLSSCFLPSRTGAGGDATDLIINAARSLDRRDALLLFPEGANWTPRRQRRATRRLLRAGHRRAAQHAAARPNVMPPQPGGTVACLQARPDLDVVLIAHAGLDTLVTARQIWQAVPLAATPMTIALRRVSSVDIPPDADGIQTWLEHEWDDLSRWVDDGR